MKRPDLSIFQMKEPPMGRILGANALMWSLALGFWWRAVGIVDVESIPSSLRYGRLTSDIAMMLGLAFLAAAVSAVLLIKKAHRDRWPANTKFGLLGAVAAIGANSVAMFTASFRIFQLGT